MNDLRFALRQLWKTRGATGVAVLTLTLGIGLITTQYSLIDGVLVRPLPFAEAQRLMHVGRKSQGGLEIGWNPIPVREYLAHREEQSTFEGVAAFHGGNLNLSREDGPPRRMNGTAVTANFFELLRVRPMLGRLFHASENEPGEPRLLVLGHGLWEEEFGGNREVLGKTVKVNGELATIIGVMPAGFVFPGREECWINLRLDPAMSEGRNAQYVEVMGRLRTGIDRRAAESELGVIANRHAQSRESADGPPLRMDVRAFPKAYAGPGTATVLFLMLAMTGLVLVLACVNVANLQLVRAAGRVRELAVRAALGAGRGRLLRQLLTEGMTLAAIGALLGTLLSFWAIRLLQTQFTTRIDTAGFIRFDLNGRTLFFTAAVTVLAGLLAGLVPAIRASRLNLSDCLKDGQRGATGLRLSRLSRWLVAGQLALACALVIPASWLALSVMRSSRANLAYDPDSILVGRIELEGPAYEQPADRVRFYNRLVDAVRAAPGVAAAAVSSRDLVASGVYAQFELEGTLYERDGERPGGWLEVVSRDYFCLVNRSAEIGRLFDARDTSSSPSVAVVNRSFAEKHWPGEDPLGRRIRRQESEAAWAVVVGVVPDLNLEGVGNNDPPAGWYLLQDQQAWGWLDLLVRARGDAASLIPTVRGAVAGIDPEQPVHTITTLRERTARRVAGLELVGTMAVVFAVTALALAGVGIYGVMSFAVAQRTREFGVRLALGATRRGILALLFRQHALRTGAGVAVGLGLGYALLRPLAPFLANIDTTNPDLYLSLAALLVAVAFVALVSRAPGRAGRSRGDAPCRLRMVKGWCSRDWKWAPHPTCQVGVLMS